MSRASAIASARVQRIRSSSAWSGAVATRSLVTGTIARESSGIAADQAFSASATVPAVISPSGVRTRGGPLRRRLSIGELS